MIASLAARTGIAPTALLAESDEMLTMLFDVAEQRSTKR